MQFDALTFLKENFGNAQGVVALVSTYGFNSPAIDTVYKWFQRENIPSEWLPLLICVLELDAGEPIRLAPYLR